MLHFHAISRLDGSELDGIHLQWAPPYPTGHSLSGFTIERREADREKQQHCFKVSDTILGVARTRGFTSTSDATIWGYPNDQENPLGGAWTYRFDLVRNHRNVTISAPGAVVAFAGRRDGRIHVGHRFVGPTCLLAGGLIEVIWIVAEIQLPSIEVCGDLIDDSRWADAKRIVTDLQVPFQVANATLRSLGDEKDTASERASPESLDGDWEEVSLYGNIALGRPFGAAAWLTTTGRPGGSGDDWDVAPFGLITASTIMPAWHRALGFAYLDRADLSKNTRYDYRLTGTVPRVDRDEQRVDLHTVPRGYRLPSHFRLADVGVFLPRSSVVSAEREPESPAEPIRKGVFFENWLRLTLPEATSRVVVDGTSDGPIKVTGSIAGDEVASVVVTFSERTEIDLGIPVDEIYLDGKGFLVAVVARPIAAGLDPFEPVDVSAVVLGVEFTSTPDPGPAENLSVINLGDSGRVERNKAPDFNKGFEVSWEPPAKINELLMSWWPVDATSAPPSEVARYRLERKWGSNPFTGRDDTDGMHVPARNADPVTDTPEPGFDVLRAFPPANRAGLSTGTTVRAIDVFGDEEIDYGKFVTFQVRCIDSIGRLSVPVISPETQLQKLVRPPPPTTPPHKAVLPPAVGPAGVQARLLQANNPDLSVADRALSGGADVVVVSWGWGSEQRRLDPHVKEFRLYEFDGSLLEVGVEITGMPVAIGGGWRLPVRFDRKVKENQFAGHIAALNEPYPIVGHGSGLVTSLSVGQSKKKPAVAPRGLSFSLMRTDGAELNPEYWDRRVMIVPRSDNPPDPDDDEVESYRVMLPATWIAVNTSRRVQRFSIGVSSADREAYRVDRRVASETVTLPGNESTVAAVEVIARHRGRPDLAVADLGPIASLTTGRMGATEVHLAFTPSAHLPAAAVVEQPMRLERMAGSAVLQRLVIADSIRLLSADGSATAWVLSALDETLLRSEYAHGEVSDRFLAHAAGRLDGLAAAATSLGDVDPTKAIDDVLANTPSRWIYRLRSVDAAGKLSADGQVLQMVARVPAPIRATSPELVTLELNGDQATVTVLHRRAVTFDGVTSHDIDPGSDLLVFYSIDPRLKPARAELATVRNRPDLAPTDLVVVRDDRGQRLAVRRLTPGADDLATESFTVPTGHRLHVWAVAVSDEGVPSRLVGPLHTANGFPTEID